MRATLRITGGGSMGKRSTRVIPQGIARASPGWKFLRAASGKFGLLLVALVALILLSPLLIQNERWVAATSVCSASVLVAGLHAAKPGRGILALGLALALLVIGRLWSDRHVRSPLTSSRSD